MRLIRALVNLFSKIICSPCLVLFENWFTKPVQFFGRIAHTINLGRVAQFPPKFSKGKSSKLDNFNVKLKILR